MIRVYLHITMSLNGKTYRRNWPFSGSFQIVAIPHLFVRTRGRVSLISTPLTDDPRLEPSSTDAYPGTYTCTILYRPSRSPTDHVNNYSHHIPTITSSLAQIRSWYFWYLRLFESMRSVLFGVPYSTPIISKAKSCVFFFSLCERHQKYAILYVYKYVYGMHWL